MLYVTIKSTVLHVWWDQHKLYQDGYYYKVTLNDKNVAYVKNYLFDFYNLQPETEYKVSIQICDENKKPLFAEPEVEFYTTIKDTTSYIDITKPPYNAIGDGEFDNTEIILKAISDCKENDVLVFPMGTYVTKSIVFNSDCVFKFENDATLTSKGE